MLLYDLERKGDALKAIEDEILKLQDELETAKKLAPPNPSKVYQLECDIAI